MRKKCPSCKVVKEIETEFGKNKNEKSGIAVFCKKCFIMKNRESKLKKDPGLEFRCSQKYTPEQRKFKSRVYGKNYKLKGEEITLEGYLAMIKKQDNKCKVCSVEFGNKNRIYIDHCHDRKEVRGLLCLNCNIAIGHAKDSVDILKKMIKYISK